MASCTNHSTCKISAETKQSTNNSVIMIKYKECKRNHAISVGGHAVDGCREFMPGGEQGAEKALLCEACGCHRNFHRKEIIKDGHVVLHPSASQPSFVPPLVPVGLANYNKTTIPFVVLQPVDYSLSQPQYSGVSQYYYHQGRHPQNTTNYDDLEQKPNNQITKRTKMEPF